MRDSCVRMKSSRRACQGDFGFDPVPSNLIKEGGGIHAKVSVWKRLHFQERYFYSNAATVSMQFGSTEFAHAKKVIEDTLPGLKVDGQRRKMSRFCSDKRLAGGAQQRYRSCGSHIIWRYPHDPA